MSDEKSKKYLKRFIQLLFAISIIALACVYGKVNALDLSDEWRIFTLYQNTNNTSFIPVIDGRFCTYSSNACSLLTENNGVYSIPIKLMNITEQPDELQLSYYSFSPSFSTTYSCSPSSNNNYENGGCEQDIGFVVTWKIVIPDDTPRKDFSLQQSIAYILANYNNVNVHYSKYNACGFLSPADSNSCVSTNSPSFTPTTIRFNTQLLGQNQYVDSDNNNALTYVFTVYYTAKLYDMYNIGTNGGMNAIDFSFGDFITSYNYYKIFSDNDLYFNISLEFSNFAINKKTGVVGGVAVDGTDSSTDEINRLQQETNEKLDDIKQQILDESPPNTSGLGSSAGWLPAGPVDSLINLPLTFLNGLNNALSSTCSPVSVPIPFVNQNVNLPCPSTLLGQINGFSTWWNSIGLIAAAFILYKYLVNLYAWVDKTLTFRENNWQDWGGI